MTRQRTVEIHAELDTDAIRRQVEALAETFEDAAAKMRAGLAKLDTTPSRPDPNVTETTP